MTLNTPGTDGDRLPRPAGGLRSHHTRGRTERGAHLPATGTQEGLASDAGNARFRRLWPQGKTRPKERHAPPLGSAVRCSSLVH